MAPDVGRDRPPPRRIRPEGEPSRRNGARKSLPTGLFSLFAASLPWTPKAPPADGEPAERGDARTPAMLAGLLSLSAAWLPWTRRRPRRGELRAEVMAALTHVDYYEDRDTHRQVESDVPGARSVGLPYREIQKRVQAKYPGGKVSIMTIRSYARDAKQEGYVLPYRRPYSRRTRNSGSS